MTFPTPVGSVGGYLAAPTAAGRHPAVLVLHGQIGMPERTREIADELAAAGFVALAVQTFSRIPGFNDEQLRADVQGPRHFLSEAFFHEGQQECRGALDYLERLPAVRRDRIGAVGFCGGGIRAVRLSVAAAEIRAVVSFYGPPVLPPQYRNASDPIVDLVQIGTQVRAPLQIHYGTSDYAVRSADVERLASEVRQSGTPVEVYSYEGATHAFYELTGAASAANAAAAETARGRYLAFLRSRLG